MPNYKLGVDSALVLKVGSADESVVKGLNKLGLPELLREVVSVSEFRTEIDIEFVTSAKYGRITYGGSLVLGDTKGQDQLKQYWLNKTKITDCRFYLDNDNFLTCDLANDPDAGFQVVKVGGSESDKSGTYSYDGEMLCAGLVALFVAHQIDGAAPTMTFPAGGTTIEDTGNGFLTAGFAVGQTLIIEGATSNDGQELITAVDAGTITCAAASFTTEASVEDMALHGGVL